MSKALDDKIELLAEVSLDNGGALHANPEGYVEPGMVKRVTIEKSKFRQQLEQMAATARELVEGWSVARVRLDEVSFTLQVGTNGALKWIMGVGLTGAATLKFKIDPPKEAYDVGVEQSPVAPQKE
ncbi:MAG: hypothetical protein ABSH35_21590 [Isosphaeraceae bacterium]|jgi:hypothetical protein